MNKKTPKLRFKKFTDAWKQHKLGDCASFRRGSFPQPYGMSEWYGGVESKPFVQVADVGDDMKLVASTKQKISKLAQPLSVYIPKGSVVVTIQGSIGRVAITQYEAFLDRTILYFEKYKLLVDKKFWSYLIKNKFADEAKRAPGGTIKTITKEALSDFDLVFPKYDEQVIIGRYFEVIDNTITLQQRKLDKLISLKKAYLYQMFPKKGSHVPEIRFSEFTDDWKQLKLGSIAEKVTKKNSNLEINETFTNSAEQGIISQNDFFDHKVSSSDNIGKYYVVGKGDFVYNPRISSTAPVGPINRNRLERAGVVSPLYTVFRVKDVEPLFLEWYFKSSCWHLYMFINGDSGARSDRFAIKDPVFFSMSILVPSKEEQFKIGMFFEKLNGNISIQKRKLEKLKQLKASYLNSMFI